MILIALWLTTAAAVAPPALAPLPMPNSRKLKYAQVATAQLAYVASKVSKSVRVNKVLAMGCKEE
ncbi:hypothetical protein GX50_04399 [[Emmonsia] crescens]|uniref:Secreted protein n=1 Tax=[Emmonsia] crescens TaxID=73230 RepID=A0A2B7ZI03_9EURO|nr:hypothetical protein GX50_04399 [Emmonsia crescens]